jgi:xyloglucan:xyloglucosyl transferase
MCAIRRLFVDETPIRVLRNLTGQVSGYEFPMNPMGIWVSLWNASWATDGGKTPIDWNHAPFTAGFQVFGVDACASTSSSLHATRRTWTSGGTPRVTGG